MPSTVRTAKLFIRPQANMQALMTSLTGVRWVDLNNPNTVPNPFVFKELTQLKERPTIGATTFSFVARLFVRIFTNVRQVLNCYDSIEGFRFVDDFGTDATIEPSLKTSLSARQPFQQSTDNRLPLRVPFEAFS
jgi:hypothetical protein